MQDWTLIENFQSGDEKAFEELVRRYQESTLNACFRFLRNSEDAKDAAQEIFIQVYRALPRLKPQAKFSTLLYRMIINHCLNVQRSRRRKRWLSLFSSQDANLTARIADPDGDPDARLEALEKQRNVQRALEALKEDLRNVVVLHRYQGLSYAEIADVLQVSVATVESRLFRAKKQLVKLLASIREED